MMVRKINQVALLASARRLPTPVTACRASAGAWLLACRQKETCLAFCPKSHLKPTGRKVISTVTLNFYN